LFRERARGKGLLLLVEGIALLPRYMRADEAKLRQILTNLIGNAVRFTEHGGVAVRSRTHEGKLVVEVEDSGPGIAPDELPRLFKKLEQTATGRQAKQGTGLGLAISQEFARLMGGEIGARSRPGEGSVFRHELPLQEGAEADLPRRAPTQRVTRLLPGPTRYRLLVVDDKMDNRTFATALLETVGFDMAQAANGEEALRASEDFKPHVVLMDMRMPVMDGTEASGRLRATPQGRAVKVAAVTASAFQEAREAARVAGADDFVRKPFRESVLSGFDP
jgi:two-component system sensor histidine kinase/response regulator